MKYKVIIREHPGTQFAHFILYGFWLALISATISTPLLLLARELFQINVRLPLVMFLLMVFSHMLVKKYPIFFVVATFIISLFFIIFLSNWEWEKILIGFVFTIIFHLLIWDYLLPDQDILRFQE